MHTVENSPEAVPGQSPPRTGLLACSVFEREIALYTAQAQHIIETRYFEMGLHDRPDTLRETLQAAIDEFDTRTDMDAIVLVYGLCGLGTAGIRAGRHRIVIPRAHDCITLFMGGRQHYAEHQRACPTCYYYTPGWNRERRVPGPDRLEKLRAEWTERFGEEDAEYLLETEHEQWALHNTAVYLDLATEDAEAEAAYAQQCAQWLGWRFERLRGDPSLLRDLLWGLWDERRFLTIQPGWQTRHSADDAILKAVRAQTLESAL